MAQEFERAYVDSILKVLDEQNWLFPQFTLAKLNNELKLLGSGGFSSVYEMYNKERPDLTFAIKVAGFQSHKVNSEEFWNTGRIQWILCQESQYIMRILDAKELVLVFDEEGSITEVKDARKKEGEVNSNNPSLHIQLVLMEKLDTLIQKDRFLNVKLKREELVDEKEVLKLAFEIGQGVACAHTNKCLHRDIKLENIFWDEKEQVYKLGDFGIAKWAEDGNAETIVYTEGYGAPEIERRLYDSYNATADIYSLGITLYLLLNNLKFPGSNGYYSKVEVQYNPEFVFPAPQNASEAMTRVIRKMCSFYPEDRYQTINEVLSDLTMVLEEEKSDCTQELFELADIATQTYKEDETEAVEVETQNSNKRAKTRAERKNEQKIIDELYREDSIKYFFAITVLLTLLYEGFHPSTSFPTDWMFLVLPVAAAIEALFQRVKAFHIIFGAVLIIYTAFLMLSAEVMLPHIVLILSVVIGCPVITLAGAVSIGLWIWLELSGKLAFLDYIYRLDLGWIFLIATLLVVYGYFNMRADWDKTTYIRAYLAQYIYDKLFPIMAIVGIVLNVLSKYYAIAIPDMIGRMHFVRTGVISFAIMVVYFWWEGRFE